MVYWPDLAVAHRRYYRRIFPAGRGFARVLLLLLAMGISDSLHAATGVLLTQVTRTSPVAQHFGGCIALLSKTPASVGVNRPGRWVSFSCSGAYATKDAANRSFEQVSYPDNQFADPTLQVKDGIGYTRTGNRVTPIPGHSEITVATRVSDQEYTAEWPLHVTVIFEDTDNDGLGDQQEVLVLGTDPELRDTDGDTLEDGFEVENCMDPLAPDDCPRWLCPSFIRRYLPVIVPSVGP